jgi:outer membrane biosynthesis protein TonB
VSFLKSQSYEAAKQVNYEKLRAGRIRFTVNEKGIVSDAKLESTSEYPELDAIFVDIFKNLKSTWKPAMNSKGEKVAQEMVFFFGTEGC